MQGTAAPSLPPKRSGRVALQRDPLTDLVQLRTDELDGYLPTPRLAPIKHDLVPPQLFADHLVEGRVGDLGVPLGVAHKDRRLRSTNAAEEK